MKIIKIISGAYGLNVNGVVKSMTSQSEPFSVDDKEADRLVTLGVAEIVQREAEMPSNEPFDDEAGVYTLDVENSEESENESEDEEIPEYSLDTPVNELRNIGKAVGITFKVGVTKEEMVEALNDYYYSGEPDLNSDDFVE